MREKRDVPEMKKLESVNSFFNKLEFVDDLYHWGKEDYWATPHEMLISNGGDCEDFATANISPCATSRSRMKRCASRM